MVEKQKDYVYVLGAFDDLHVVEGELLFAGKGFFVILTVGRLQYSLCTPFAFVLFLIERG